MLRRSEEVLIIFLLSAVLAMPAHGQMPGIFSVENTTGPSSQVQGYGLSPGGSAGAVYHVTQLNDGGPGSLRDGVLNRSGPRTIVFDVGGEILLQQPLTIQQPYLTIDGSTAPEPGITLRAGDPAGGRLVIGGTHDITLRYLRLIGPWEGEFDPEEADLLCVNGASPPDNHARHIVLDHLTLHGASAGAPAFLGTVSDVTLSWCLIYGSLHATEIGDASAPAGQRSRFSIHHNLYARNREGNPQIQSGMVDLDFVNNIIYDFHEYGVRIRNLPGSAPASANLIGNYFVAGSSPYAFKTLVFGTHAGGDAEDGNPSVSIIPQGTVVTETNMGSLFVAGNVMSPYTYDQYSTVAEPLTVPAAARVNACAASDLKTQMLPLVGTRFRFLEEQSMLDSLLLLLGFSATPTSDFDADEDVDAADFDQFAACRTRDRIANLNPACVEKDHDGDGDVDQNDLGIFHRCVGWNGGLLPPTCLIHPLGHAVTSDPEPGPPVDYYVATNGNDEWSGRLPAPNGSHTDGPFRTLQRAASVLTAGSTCEIQAGVYNGSIIFTQSGTQSAPIRLRVASGQQAVLDGLNENDYALTLSNASWIIIEGLKVRNYRKNGIWLVDAADHVTVRNCTVHGCGGTGIHVRGGDDCLIEYNEVYGNTCGIFISWRDSNQNYAQRATVRYNLAYDHGALDPESGDGIGADAALDGTFENNICWNNRDDGMDISIRSMNNLIRGNIALLNGYPVTADGDGNGIKVSTNGGGGHTLHHNFALRNRRSGLDQDIQMGVPRNYFYNNTAYGNGESGLMLDAGGRGDAGNNAVAKNNLLAGNNVLGIGRPDLYACCTSPLLESDYNFIGDGPTLYGGSVQEGPHSRFGNPQLVNPLATIDLVGSGDLQTRWTHIWNQVAANFAAQSGSPCTGGGVSIPGITQKPSPSMGAIE